MARRREAKISVEANDFGDDVANLGDELAADVFDFVGTNAANFFDDAEVEAHNWNTAPDEDAGEIQRQRDFEGDWCLTRVLLIRFRVD